MYLDFSALFHQSSKDRTGQGSVSLPLDTSLWPKEWTEIVYKEYPRLEKVPLVMSQPTGEASAVIAKRTSARDFSKRELSIAQLSVLLQYACGITREEGEYHRAQPSGGGRYPIEAYVLIFVGSKEVPSGVYHYNVKAHALDTLWNREFSAEDVASLFTYTWAQRASLSIVLPGVFRRNQMKYGERGYRQVLIEAGAILENVYLLSAELGIKCTAIDGVREENIEKLLDIDGISESAICSLVLG